MHVVTQVLSTVQLKDAQSAHNALLFGQAPEQTAATESCTRPPCSLGITSDIKSAEVCFPLTTGPHIVSPMLEAYVRM